MTAHFIKLFIIQIKLAFNGFQDKLERSVCSSLHYMEGLLHSTSEWSWNSRLTKKHLSELFLTFLILHLLLKFYLELTTSWLIFSCSSSDCVSRWTKPCFSHNFTNVESLGLFSNNLHWWNFDSSSISFTLRRTFEGVVKFFVSDADLYCFPLEF